MVQSQATRQLRRSTTRGMSFLAACSDRPIVGSSPEERACWQPCAFHLPMPYHSSLVSCIHTIRQRRPVGRLHLHQASRGNRLQSEPRKLRRSADHKRRALPSIPIHQCEAGVNPLAMDGHRRPVPPLPHLCRFPGKSEQDPESRRMRGRRAEHLPVCGSRNRLESIRATPLRARAASTAPGSVPGLCVKGEA